MRGTGGSVLHHRQFWEYQGQQSSGGNPDNWQLQLDFLSNLVDLFTIGPDATKVGAVVFSESVDLAFTLDTYTDAQSVKNAINGLAYLGETTNTPEGLKVTREQCFNQLNGDRIGVLNLAIFISDGVPWPSYRRNPALQEAEALKSSGASVIAIGVTNVIDRDLLRAISSAPQIQGQNFFVATDFTVLSEIRKSVGEGTCQVVQGSKVKVYHQWQPVPILINQRMLHESLFTSQLLMTTNVYLCIYRCGVIRLSCTVFRIA